MHRRKPRSPAPSAPPRPQRGAVLAVSLLFLVVVTLVGVTAARTARLEGRMATHARLGAEAFEGAETALRRALADNHGALLDAMDAGRVELAVSLTDGDGNPVADPVEREASLSYLGRAAVPQGWSAGSGGSVDIHRFELTGQAGIPETNTSATTRQGLQRLFPGANP